GSLCSRWAARCGRAKRPRCGLPWRVLVPCVGGLSKLPHGLPQGAAELRELLAPEEQQRNEQDQQEVLWCEDVGLDKLHPTHRSLPLCQTARDDQQLAVHPDYSAFCRRAAQGRRRACHGLPSRGCPAAAWLAELVTTEPLQKHAGRAFSPACFCSGRQAAHAARQCLAAWLCLRRRPVPAPPRTRHRAAPPLVS